MKKIFALILMSITVCVNANAQWHKKYIEADELRETEACYANIYSCSIGRFICLSDGDWVIIECEDGIFNIENLFYTEKFNPVRGIRIGLYKGNELLELIKDVDSWSPKGDYNQAYIGKSSCFVNGEFVSSYDENEDYTGGYNIGHKIIHHLKYVGSVRIIVSRYGDPAFDITIPMNPNIQTYITKEKSHEISKSTDTVNTKTVISSDYDYYNTSDYKG